MSKWEITNDLLERARNKPVEDITKKCFELYYYSLESKLKALVDKGVDITDINLIEKQEWKVADSPYLARTDIAVKNVVVDSVCIKHSVI